MGYVFISYSRADQTYVQRLALQLGAQGIESWIDYRLVPGDAFGPTIQTAIDGCDAFLVVLTPDAVASTWVRREIVYAESKKKPVLPLLLVDCQKPIELIALQHEDVRGDREIAATFVDRLRALTNGPLTDQALTPADPSVDAGTPAVRPPVRADWTGWWDDRPIAQEVKRAIQILNRSGEVKMPRPLAVRVICVANQRHTGKTTSAVNIAVALALHGNRVLVIDLDSKADASIGLDVPHHRAVPDVYQCLVSERPMSDVVQKVTGIPNLWCVPATIDLDGAEVELVSMVARESRLAKALEQHIGQYDYDYIFIDCPPSLSLLTVNALVASKEVMIPVRCEYYALEGIQQLTNNVELVKIHLNPTLEISTVLLTMYDRRTRLADAVEQDVRAHFGDRVLTAVIPRNDRVSEAPNYGQSVITYDPGSRGATSYFEAALEIAVRGARLEAS